MIFVTCYMRLGKQEVTYNPSLLRRHGHHHHRTTVRVQGKMAAVDGLRPPVL